MGPHSSTCWLQCCLLQGMCKGCKAVELSSSREDVAVIVDKGPGLRATALIRNECLLSYALRVANPPSKLSQPFVRPSA